MKAGEGTQAAGWRRVRPAGAMASDGPAEAGRPRTAGAVPGGGKCRGGEGGGGGVGRERGLGGETQARAQGSAE